MSKKTIAVAAAKSRVAISRLFGLAIIFVVLFTGHSWDQGALVDILLEVSGLFLLSVCSFGRLWALTYISGYKGDRVITEGPYSVVRHPLYFFSLIGGLGIGLASENLLVLGSIIVFYLAYYPLTILAEEDKLADRFGQPYIEYMKDVPRFVPKLSQLTDPTVYEVNTGKYVRNFIDAMWFIWLFLLLHIAEQLQEMGVLPVLLRVP